MVTQDPGEVIANLAVTVLQLLVFVLQATLLGLGWRGFLRYHALTWWTLGVLLLLTVPTAVTVCFLLDPVALGVDTNDPAQLVGFVFGLVVGVVLLLVFVIGMTAASVPPAVAWWGSVGVGGWPRWGLRRCRRGVWLGLWTGGVAGVISLVAMLALGVEEGAGVKALQAMFPGADDLPWPVLLITSMATVTLFAIAEEVTYRGLLLPAGWRAFGRTGVGFWVSATLVSAVWSVMHLGNTDSPLIKMAQIFLLGLWFAWLARRFGLPAAIAGHVGLNLVAAVLGLTVYALGWA